MPSKSRRRTRLRIRIAAGRQARVAEVGFAFLALLLAFAARPGVAEAHGPIAAYGVELLREGSRSPGGPEAKVIDGDLRMWLSVPPSETLVILDYRGAPYLRFSRAGVEVNRNSSMYYLNQTPVAETPPTYLSASTPPSWHRVSGGHAYEWHDGRLHALATVALAPVLRRVVRRSLEDPARGSTGA